MHGADAGVEAHLLGGVDRRREVPSGAHCSMKAASCGFFAAAALRQRMIGRDRHELGAEQRVRPRGEDLDSLSQLGARRRSSMKRTQQAFRAADPVLLHQAHLVRPAVERVERGQQVFGVVADLEEPLVEIALLDRRAARQPRPSITCSLASTVWSTGSQLTLGIRARPARAPGSRETASAGACSMTGRRWRPRATSRATAPST